MVNDLGYKNVKFPVFKKNYQKIQQKNNICINVFSYEYGVTYPVHLSKQKFENYVDLLLINDENKSHYVYIKDFNKFMFNTTKHKNKKHFCRYCLQCFSSKRALVEHKETCLKINSKQIVKLRRGSIRFENHFKQLTAPFKIYADFEYNLEKIQTNKRRNDTSYTEKYQDHIPCSFAYKVVCIDDNFNKLVFLYTGENAVYRFIEAILEEYDYCKKMMNEHFNKKLFMSVEDEKRFQSSNKCWICNKLFTGEDKKVREHDHIIEKHRSLLIKIVMLIFLN